ncbi:hypothetical protein LRS74_28015 [Streptomyces sp. LX-29]|uniref:hypothetical protein n=1 Tax=Streptomyces sp. LX-29 TaxID=2900152 RepID=UPI00240DF53D|nr:hypothetical protein [Streptomyces sp. LX-29]WFB10455.1 hypothetical protein LRS74_28015 [Streptomyces sp. LX-29]
MASLSSPFSDGFVSAEEADRDALTTAALLSELGDERFEEALQALVGEVAAAHLRAATPWSPDASAPVLPASEFEGWLARRLSEADDVLGRLGERFADRPADSLSVEEVDTATQELLEQRDLEYPAMQQLFGSLVRKVAGIGKGIAKAGLAAVGKVLPTGVILAALRKLLDPLLRWVLRKATNRLPVSLRPAASALAKRVLRESAPGDGAQGHRTDLDSVGEASHRFDTQLAEVVLAPSDSAAEQTVADAVQETEWSEHDPVQELDEARARLVGQLAEAASGEPPAAQLQQFVPAVMAAMPMVRAGVGLIGGRERVARFLEAGLAKLISGYVGPAAAKALARPIVDVGMRALRLEAESAELLGAEAMVATLEDTVRHVLSLPQESLDEPLRVEAELQEAFAEAAARHLPREVLRADLPSGARAEAQDGAVWLFMPRATRPCFRYKKLSRVLPLSISRIQAGEVLLRTGETLEGHLLDAGVRSWPVEADLHLYETLPGTHAGHLAAFEDGASAEDFEEFTPEAAALLVGRPGMGRRVPTWQPGGGPPRRLFRLVVPGAPRRRRRTSRFVVRIDPTAAKPLLRVHFRLGEREAHELTGHLAGAAMRQVVVCIRAALSPAARRGLARRLAKGSERLPGGAFPAERAGALAEHISEAILSTLAKELPKAAATVRTAAQDPASGLTLSFTFSFADKGSLMSGMPEAAPTLTIRPGYRSD